MTPPLALFVGLEDVFIPLRWTSTCLAATTGVSLSQSLSHYLRVTTLIAHVSFKGLLYAPSYPFPLPCLTGRTYHLFNIPVSMVGFICIAATIVTLGQFIKA